MHVVRPVLNPGFSGFGCVRGPACPVIRGVLMGNFITFWWVDHGNLLFRDSQWPHHTDP